MGGVDPEVITHKMNVNPSFKPVKQKRRCKTRENSKFLKMGKMIISVKTRNFFRSRMTKRISPLESFHKI